MNSDAPFVCIVDKINDTETLLILQMILVYVVKAKHLIDVIESFWQTTLEANQYLFGYRELYFYGHVPGNSNIKPVLNKKSLKMPK